MVYPVISKFNAKFVNKKKVKGAEQGTKSNMSFLSTPGQSK